MSAVVEIIFWSSLILVAAPYVLYPASLLLLAPLGRRNRTDESAPTVTLVVSAFNEAAVIRQKIENALKLDYPSERLQVMVISDASDDATDAIVGEYSADGVLLCRQEERRGKSAGLSRFIPQADGEIIVFSDANSLYAPDAIRKLVRHFADRQVGYVVGHQAYVNDHGEASVAESLYWKYETWIKKSESRIGSVVGGDGAIFAIRAELFDRLRDDDINDFIIPLRIVARGYRGVFDREAVCHERTADDFGGEFRRKARIVNRSWRAVSRVPQVLNPLRVGLFAYQVAVHKVIRWLVPWFLLVVLATNIALLLRGSWLYQMLLGLQLAFYGAASLRFVPGIRHVKPVYVAFYFCLVNVASALGTVAFLLGRRYVTWTPQRVPQPSDSQANVERRTDTESSPQTELEDRDLEKIKQ